MKSALSISENLLDYTLAALIVVSMFHLGAAAESEYRVQTSIEYKYTGIVLDNTSARDIKFRAENKISESKELKTYIYGANASFVENQQDTRSYELEGNSKKEFVVRVEPDSIGDKKLVFATENMDLGINTTTSIPVTVKNYADVSETSEVPGIGTIQLIMLLLASSGIYVALI